MAKEFDIKAFSEFPIPTVEEWKDVSEKSLKGKSVDTLAKKTYEGITLKPIYVKKDVENLEHLNHLPGEGNFVRGTKHQGYIQSPWKIAQEICAPSPKQLNEALKYDLERGLTSINIKLDKAGRTGKDALTSAGNLIGQDGVSINQLVDLETVLEGIDIKQTPIMIHAGASAITVYGLIVAYCENNGISLSKINAFVGNDPIGVLAESGFTEVSIQTQYNIMSEIVKSSLENAPQLKTILVDCSRYHEAGGSAVEELAYAVATGVEYIRALIDRGISINDATKQIYFEFSIGSNVFMEIAKFRAARMLWQKVVEAFGGSTDNQKMYIHARTSRYTKTKHDPYVNMLRTTMESFSGVVGGIDSMHVSTFDEVIRTPDAFSRRIARNQQTILQEEAHLDRIIDPAGGSWYVETLTNELAKLAWDEFQNIEAQGGMLQALKANVVQNKIEEKSNLRKRNVSYRKDRIVGTNMYPNIEEKMLQAQNDFNKNVLIQEVKERTLIKNAEYNQFVEQISQALASGEQSLSHLINSAKANAPLGQMFDAYKDGGDKVDALNIHRAAQEFENLREIAENYRVKTGDLPKVQFLNLGPIPKHKARSDFSTGYFAAGGFEAVINNGFNTPDEAIVGAINSGISTFVINGTDEQYEQMVPEIAKGIKEKIADSYIMLAGKPTEEAKEKYSQAGIDEYIYLGSNCYKVLENLQRVKGVRS